ncbi:hypothetical protein EV649_8067 [Kribbella sp. VKM Ac-2569]|uniref:hypothetical protein n=1 Tax=Kribbella sp. VKM Ac-2569 TaxID=2512220 RepID=UPI00102BE7D7|nr:hypothetical protein [Kribbella sp. VKM Ac-2569]RZT07650.1 hypothetical protein EV649_8067 [Kribbella sp. VKM Ac-2569]
MAGGAAGAGKSSKLAKNLVKYGVRYGPLVVEAVRHGREPAQQAVQAAWAKRSARRKAVEHALTVRDGSLLKVIKDGQAIFFVFSGDAIVTTYPVVPQSSYPELLRHADLDKRESAVVLAARRQKILPKVRRKR